MEEGDTKQRGGRTAEAEVARERESQSGGGGGEVAAMEERRNKGYAILRSCPSLISFIYATIPNLTLLV